MSCMGQMNDLRLIHPECLGHAFGRRPGDARCTVLESIAEGDLGDGGFHDGLELQ